MRKYLLPLAAIGASCSLVLTACLLFLYHDLNGFYPWQTENVLCVEGPDGSGCVLVQGESGDEVHISAIAYRDTLPPDSLAEISVTYEGEPIKAHYIWGARPGVDIAVTLP